MTTKEYIDEIIREIKFTGCRFGNREKLSLEIAIYVLVNLSNYTIKDYKIWKDSDQKVNILVYFKSIWLYGIHIIIYPKGKPTIKIERVGFFDYIVTIMKIWKEHFLLT
jgi:hypothetical protein